MQYAMDRAVCQKLPKKLYFAGVFHIHLSEKKDTSGGCTANRFPDMQAPHANHPR